MSRRPAIFSQPPGLDDDAKMLHREVQEYALNHELDDYFVALAEVTGNRELAPPRVPPVKTLGVTAEEAGLDPNTEWVDSQARELARRENIGYLDAAEIVELDIERRAADLDDGSHTAEWRDTSRAMSATPWNPDHLERDKRRAVHAGVDFTQEAWKAAAEEGRDMVFEQASEQRAQRLGQLERQREGFMLRAKAIEGNRRREALEREMDRRAGERLYKDASEV